MLLCINCKHHVAKSSEMYDECRALPAIETIEPVRGRLKVSKHYCDMQRTETGDCGPEGKLYVPKER